MFLKTYGVLLISAWCILDAFGVKPIFKFNMEKVKGGGTILKGKPLRFDCHDVCTLTDDGVDGSNALRLENTGVLYADATQFASGSAAKLDKCISQQNCSNGFTLSVWTRLNGDRPGDFYVDAILGTDGYDGLYLELYTPINYLRFLAMRNGYYLTMNCWFESVDYDKWTHWAIVSDQGFFENKTYHAYRDGVEQPESICTHFYTFYPDLVEGDGGNPDMIYIGCNRGNLTNPDQCNAGFYGDIDDLEIYDEPLSARKIKSIYCSGSGDTGGICASNEESEQ